MCCSTLGLDEKLMRCLVGKGHDFGLDAGAITGPDARDLTIIER